MANFWDMEKPANIPEEAQEEPRIVSPKENDERAARLLDWQERHDATRWPQADDPLRPPGDLSPPPDRKTT